MEDGLWSATTPGGMFHCGDGWRDHRCVCDPLVRAPADEIGNTGHMVHA